jgi:hypothetical protein
MPGIQPTIAAESALKTVAKFQTGRIVSGAAA